MNTASSIPLTSHSINPSAWPERLPEISLATAGLGISTYLGLYQLGIVRHVWDPLFGNGSRRVLHSRLSRSLPVPDALLGAIGYAVETVLAAIGGPRRWHNRPRTALAYGLTSFAMGAVSLGLAIYQPLVVRALCTLCLCSALISLLLAIRAIREFRAALQEWKQRRLPAG